MMQTQTTAEHIQHQGLITEVSNQKAVIQLMETAACTSCSAKGACGVSEVDKKTFEVADQGFQIGQKVNVEITSRAAIKALFTAYLIPFLIVFGSLVIFISVGVSDGLSGLLALLTLPIYYLFTRLLLSKDSSQFNLIIRKL